MRTELLYLICGFLLGAALQISGLTRRGHFAGAMAMKDATGVRTMLFALGSGMALTALMCWLAVTDVDLLTITPLNTGVLIGAVLFGAAAGLCGATPFTLLGGIGGDRLFEGLCGTVGCVAGALLASLLAGGSVPELFAPVEGTLFRLTLRDPYLLDGSFLSLACAGAVVCVIAMFVRPMPKPEAPIKDAEDASKEEVVQPSDPPAMTDHPELEKEPEKAEPAPDRAPRAIAEAQCPKDEENDSTGEDSEPVG